MSLLPREPGGSNSEVQLPTIKPDDPFVKVVKALSVYFVDELTLPSTFEQLRTTSAGNNIRVLVEHLVLNCTNPALINALLTLKWHFSTLESDDRGLNETRANACEIVAWRFLTHVSERDAIDFCLYELPPTQSNEEVRDVDGIEGQADERTDLLQQFRPRSSLAPTTSARPASKRIELLRSLSGIGIDPMTEEPVDDDEEGDPTTSFTGLSGLEIAAVADCKKFLSQRIVQKIITGIWNGDITFWQSMSAHAKKKPQLYNKRKSDPFIRLRVPRYIKAFEVLFFATFLALYYAVLVERNPYHITPLEVGLYIWLAAFSYDEVSEFIDAGSIFYAVDIWNGCDVIIILIGAAFLITRYIGLVQDSNSITDTAFDILSLEALFMVPRVCSLLSLHPYFGTLIPCLKEMTKDFVKFMVVVAILYVGFLTTFSLLARDTFTLSKMSWILIKVFFGSSYLGFDIMNDINAKLGPPLMLIFVTMTNILLITSLISILSDSFSKVIAHAREEYLFVYSVYVLEASTGDRLTHFYPPLNLIPLIFIRPLRIFFTSEQLRNTRIILLKVTHSPIVAAIWLFEGTNDHLRGTDRPFPSIGPGTGKFTGSMLAPGKKQRPFLSDRANSKTHSGQFLEFDVPDSPDPQSHSVRNKKENGKAEVIVANNKDLEAKVADLSLKIAELTALIMAQQGTTGEE